jgi:hypothetical protein
LGLPGSKLCIQDSEDGRKVQAEIKKYDQLLKNKLGNDKFVTVGVQTRDNGAVLRKLKEAQTTISQHQDSSTQWEALVEMEPVASAPTIDTQRFQTVVLRQDVNAKVLFASQRMDLFPQNFEHGQLGVMYL